MNLLILSAISKVWGVEIILIYGNLLTLSFGIRNSLPYNALLCLKESKSNARIPF